MDKTLVTKVGNNVDNLKGRMYYIIPCDTIVESPCPSEVPMPPLAWLKHEDKHDLSLLDWATEQAIEFHWKGQVKACQYAIFHRC